MVTKIKQYLVMLLCVVACMAAFYLQYQGFARYHHAVQACEPGVVHNCTSTHDVTIKSKTAATETVRDDEWGNSHTETTHTLTVTWNGAEHVFVTKDAAESAAFNEGQTIQAKSINGKIIGLQSNGVALQAKNWWPFPYFALFALMSVTYFVAVAAFLVQLPAVRRRPLLHKRLQGISFKCNVAGSIALIYPVVTAVYIYFMIDYVW